MSCSGLGLLGGNCCGGGGDSGNAGLMLGNETLARVLVGVVMVLYIVTHSLHNYS